MISFSVSSYVVVAGSQAKTPVPKKGPACCSNRVKPRPAGSPRRMVTPSGCHDSSGAAAADTERMPSPSGIASAGIVSDTGALLARGVGPVGAVGLVGGGRGQKVVAQPVGHLQPGSRPQVVAAVVALVLDHDGQRGVHRAGADR